MAAKKNFKATAATDPEREDMRGRYRDHRLGILGSSIVAKAERRPPGGRSERDSDGYRRAALFLDVPAKIHTAVTPAPMTAKNTPSQMSSHAESSSASGSKIGPIVPVSFAK